MKLILIPVSLVILLLTTLSFLWWRENSGPVSDSSEKIKFVIPKGRSTSQIANMLYEKGIIKNALAFKVYIQVTDKTKEIPSGEFKLSPSQKLTEVVDSLLKGPDQVWVTIPEGLRREEIVERFIDGLEMDHGRVDIFRKEFLESSKDKEGYLFPDTYLFPPDASGSTVVSALTKTFEKKLDSGIKREIESSNYEEKELVTLASLIERETKSDDERRLVAGIFLKRLENGWPLQVDAAVQYAVANKRCLSSFAQCEWWPILTKADLEINSNFNTYKFRGLPPSPIANPGLSSLKAAIFPEDSPYWYYIHDAEGKIYFAKSLEEHNENIRRFLK